MRTTDVTQVIEFASVPVSDDLLKNTYEQFSTETVNVNRDGLRVTVNYARQTLDPLAPEIDWQLLGYGRWTSNHSSHTVRTTWVIVYLGMGIVISLLTSVLSRYPAEAKLAIENRDEPADALESPS
ncbi:hypothetical protein CA85_41530 [Allorhodopirellula solitaria]|uniref:Uncharacterized protein n=1 Tax=Allorhodopirellula solitaria TaxID=2527987 RepID=A0A5C5X1X8_9BACT|nr:hypothetical protein CA85_41530 [Allorhodopirellula solitaria]